MFDLLKQQIAECQKRLDQLANSLEMVHFDAQALGTAQVSEGLGKITALLAKLHGKYIGNEKSLV